MFYLAVVFSHAIQIGSQKLITQRRIDNIVSSNVLMFHCALCCKYFRWITLFCFVFPCPFSLYFEQDCLLLPYSHIIIYHTVTILSHYYLPYCYHTLPLLFTILLPYSPITTGLPSRAKSKSVYGSRSGQVRVLKRKQQQQQQQQWRWQRQQQQWQQLQWCGKGSSHCYSSVRLKTWFICSVLFYPNYIYLASFL